MNAIDRLIIEQQPYLKALARNIAKTLPHHVEYDELVAFGQIGLTEAANAFDPRRGVSFTTFAHYRVRGAIFDGLRKMTWLPPAARRTVVEQSAADELVQVSIADIQLGGKEATPAKLSKAPPQVSAAPPALTPAAPPTHAPSPQSREDAARELAASQFAQAVARLGAVFAASSLRDDEPTNEPTDENRRIAPSIESRELRARVRFALERLPDDQSSLIRMLYIEGKSMAQVGTFLGKNKSTICRRHAEAIDSLRETLRVDPAVHTSSPASSNFPSEHAQTAEAGTRNLGKPAATTAIKAGNTARATLSLPTAQTTPKVTPSSTSSAKAIRREVT